MTGLPKAFSVLVSLRHPDNGTGVAKGAFTVTGQFELNAESRRAGKSALNERAVKHCEAGRLRTVRIKVCKLCRFIQISCKNEQNLEVIERELRVEFFVETPPVKGRTFTSGSHPQAPRNRGNADEKTGVPGEEDRARANDSQETRHKKQTG